MSKSLSSLPAGFNATREAMHAVAEQIISPARAAASGGEEIALEAAANGFGTPLLPGGGRVRVERLQLVVEHPARSDDRAELSSLAAAATAVGLPAEGLSDEPLAIDADSAALLAAAFELGDQVLSQLRDEAAAAADASPLRLWPEHFDIAFEQGSESAGQRAGYGLSPGDEQHDEPYFYVGPWSAPSDLDGWEAVGFTGAQLGWSDLASSDDPKEAALNFLRAKRDLLLEC